MHDGHSEIISVIPSHTRDLKSLSDACLLFLQLLILLLFSDHSLLFSAYVYIGFVIVLTIHAILASFWFIDIKQDLHFLLHIKPLTFLILQSYVLPLGQTHLSLRLFCMSLFIFLLQLLLSHLSRLNELLMVKYDVLLLGIQRMLLL